MTGTRRDETGTVRAAIAPLLAEPRIASEQVSQLLRGQSFNVSEVHGEWLRVTASLDGYEGWLNTGYTTRNQNFEPSGISLGCLLKHGSEISALPFGAFINSDDDVVSGDVVLNADRPSRFPAEGNALAASALRFYRGTPYQWGGLTPWGADCSGFLQNLFRAHGIDLPRDSSAQARHGAASTSTPDESKVADLLFFSERPDRRITHVGLALGGTRMAHVALGRGGFAVEDFGGTASSDPYVKQLRDRFQFARSINR